MMRGDLYRLEESGNELEQRLLAAIQESDMATYAAKHEFARAMWGAENEREQTLRSKGERIVPLPTLILTTLLGGGIFALVNSWVSTPWAHALLWATLLVVFLCGLSALWFGYRILDVQLGQSIHPGLALEKHEDEGQWQATAASHYLAKYKTNLGRMTELAFHVRLTKEWTLAMVVAGLVGALLTATVWAIEAGNPPTRLDVLGAMAGVIAWAGLRWRLVKRPKPHRRA